MNPYPPLNEEQAARAAALHKAAVVVQTYGGPFSATRTLRGWRAGSLNADGSWTEPTRAALRDYLIPDMAAGGVDCVVAHVGGADDLALWLAEFDSSAPEAVQAVTAAEVRAAKDAGSRSFILLSGGAQSGNIDSEINRLHLYHRVGVRAWELTHSARNLVSGGCGEGEDAPGLSRLGELMVAEMNRLKIILDISHISDRGFWDVLERSSAPIMATHSNCRAVCDHGRNLTDDMIRQMTAAGGLVCLNFFPRFVKAENPTVEDLVDHIDHISELAGPEYVGLGPDFCAGRWSWVLRSWWSYGSSDHNKKSLVIDYPKGVEDTTQMGNITRALVKRGYSDEEIAGILGGNFLRYFDSVVM